MKLSKWKLKNVMLGLFMGHFLSSSGAFASSVSSRLESCECQFAGKDYDPAKGYFFDRIKYLPYPHVSARFGCQYYCRDSENKYWIVTHVYQGSYFGTTKGTAANATKNICPDSISKFIPRYDLIGHVNYYDTELVGNFSAMKSSVKEVVDWAQAYCR